MKTTDTNTSKVDVAKAHQRKWKMSVQEAEENFRIIADAAPVLIWRAGTDKLCYWFNQVWLDFTGRTMEQEYGNGWAEGVHPDDFDRCLEIYITNFDARKSCSMDYRLMRGDGQYRWILDNGVPVYDSSNTFIGYIGSCIDITERKLAEEAVQQAQIDTEKALKARTQFISNMSHEIRTPMNGIIGLSSLALNHPMSPEVRDYLVNIEASSKSLLTILNQVLDFSKLEASRVEIEQIPFSPNELLSNLEALFQESARQKGLDLICVNKLDPLAQVIGDQFRLQQVLSNLIGNAIKFTTSGSVTAAISLRGLEPSKIILRFSIKDTGIGIPEKHLDELMHPFTQIDNSIARRFGGTGLGLAISSQLLELMDSKLNISSEEGSGSTFSFDVALGSSPSE